MDGAWAKTFSKQVAKKHETSNATFTMADGGDPVAYVRKYPHLRMVRLTSDNEAHRLAGPRVSPKAIRGLLWRARSERMMARENWFLWTCYDPEAKLTYVGWGVVVLKEVAERMKDKWKTQVLEV